MKRVNRKRLIKILGLLLPILLFIGVSQEFLFLHFDENRVRMDGFYEEEKNSLDVVLLGSSEIYAGFAPTLAYEAYGFTSYPYVLGNNLSSFLKPQLKEILKTQDPGLIVIEINAFLYKGNEMLSEEGKLRRYVDNIPMSANRLQTIWEMDYSDKLSCAIPFIKYHSKWADVSDNLATLENSLFLRGRRSLLKGLTTNTTVYQPGNEVVDVSKDLSKKELDPTLEKNLIELLEYCRELGLTNVVFARFPHVIHPGEVYDCYCRANRAEEIIREYGYEYLPLERLNEEIGIDPNADFYNNEHLNVFGQRKLTSYLGKKFVEDYDLAPRSQTEENRSHWQQCVDFSRLYFQYAEEESRKNTSKWLYEDKELVEALNAMAAASQ